MFSTNRQLMLSLAMFVILAAGHTSPTQGDVIIQQASAFLNGTGSQTILFTSFNTTQGTLQSVDLSILAFNQSATVSVINNSPFPSGFTYSLFQTLLTIAPAIRGSAGSSAEIGRSLGPGPFQFGTFDVSFGSPIQGFYSATSLSGYTGPGLVSVFLSGSQGSSFSGGPNVFQIGANPGSLTGTVTLRYTYSAVPEPEPLFLAGLAIGAICAFGRFRRATAAL